MHNVTEPTKFRERIRACIAELIGGDEKKAINVEKGMFNYSIRCAAEKNVVKKWDNAHFAQIYVDRFRTVWVNLQNEELKQKVITGEIRAHEAGLMTHQEMLPSRWEPLIKKKEERDKEKYAPKLEANTDNYTCRKCGSKKCSYYQLQTRSADEPMTTYVTCIDCGTRWKC